MNKKQLILGKGYIIHKPDIDKIDIISDVIIECSFKHFHSLNKQFHIYDLNFTKIKNKTESIILENVNDGKLCIFSEISKIMFVIHYKFNEMNKLTIKFQGGVSDLKICYYLKLPLPISTL